MVFDRLAKRYDTARPGYPDAAIEQVQASCELKPGSRLLEIGCGTGQATAALAATGCHIRCLEPGARLAALARRNLAGCTNVEVVVTSFEAAEENPGTFDAVVSATAFHWIDPTVGFPKAATVARPGGHLALMTNAHVAGGTEDQVAAEFGALHRRLAPQVGMWTPADMGEVVTRARGGGDIAHVWSRVDRKFVEPPAVDHLFEPPSVSVYPWLANYDRRSYLAMMSTQSSYALLGGWQRRRLLSAMGAVIDRRLGGTITKAYLTIVATARRRG